MELRVVAKLFLKSVSVADKSMPVFSLIKKCVLNLNWDLKNGADDEKVFERQICACVILSPKCVFLANLIQYWGKRFALTIWSFFGRLDLKESHLIAQREFLLKLRTKLSREFRPYPKTLSIPKTRKSFKNPKRNFRAFTSKRNKDSEMLAKC